MIGYELACGFDIFTFWYTIDEHQFLLLMKFNYKYHTETWIHGLKDIMFLLQKPDA